MLNKPTAQFTSGRNVRLSYVPEDADSSAVSDDAFTVRKWTQAFGNRLKLRGLSITIDEPAGTRIDGRLSGSLSDLVVVFTVDYALGPPSHVETLLQEVVSGVLKAPPGMWLARYDPDDYADTPLTAGAPWHVLTGTGPDGTRFKRPADRSDEHGGWQDDLARAIKAFCEPSAVADHKICAICALATTSGARAPGARA